jgi:hypothetical protein
VAGRCDVAMLDRQRSALRRACALVLIHPTYHTPPGYCAAVRCVPQMMTTHGYSATDELMARRGTAHAPRVTWRDTLTMKVSVPACARPVTLQQPSVGKMIRLAQKPGEPLPGGRSTRSGGAD